MTVITKDREVAARKLEEEGRIKIDPEYGYEYSYTWEEQIGTQLRAGFLWLISTNPRTRITVSQNMGTTT